MAASTQVHINAASMGAAITPAIPLGVHHSPWVSFHLVWTGTPTGSFVVEASNDWTRGSNGTWESVPASITAPAGSAGSYMLSLVDVCVAYLRIRYVYTSGTGTLTVTAQTKDAA